MRKQKKYHYIYKTTNPKGRYYIGAHSTDDLNDGYMGSGLLVKKSIKSHGKENHRFEILEFCLDRQSLFEREAELVPSELMNDPLCMNLCKGGIGGIGGNGGTTFTGMVSVKDRTGKTFQVDCSDPRLLTGDLKYITDGKVAARDRTGKTFQVDCSDPRLLTGDLKYIAKGSTPARDRTGKTFQVDCSDPRLLTGDLKYITEGKVTIRDRTGKTFQVDCSDPRYISGELVVVFKNKKHSEKTKALMSNSSKGTGKGKSNSQFGTCWIFSTSLKKSIKIKKNSLEEFIVMGWEPGRKIKF